MRADQRCDCAIAATHDFKVGQWKITAATGVVYDSCDRHLAYLCHFTGTNVVEFVASEPVAAARDFSKRETTDG